MNDLDPRIWENKTLGAAVNSTFLDQVEAQAQEDRDAEAEGRPARKVTCPDRYPGHEEDVTTPSTVTSLVYTDPAKPASKPKADGKS